MKNNIGWIRKENNNNNSSGNNEVNEALDNLATIAWTGSYYDLIDTDSIATGEIIPISLDDLYEVGEDWTTITSLTRNDVMNLENSERLEAIINGTIYVSTAYGSDVSNEYYVKYSSQNKDISDSTIYINNFELKTEGTTVKARSTYELINLFSGSYNDLTDKPDISFNDDGELVITIGGITKTFTPKE